jgi:hypothetical protein
LPTKPHCGIRNLDDLELKLRHHSIMRS